MIFVGGIHGVGKSYFCNELAIKTKLRVYSASQLIANVKKEDNEVNKLVKGVVSNQTYLIKALNEVKESSYIFDGHFCLLDSDGIIQRIPMDTYEKMPIKEILVIYDDVQNIIRRLEKRDEIKHDIEKFKKFQNEELSYAKEISELLRIPIRYIKFSLDYTSMINTIIGS